MTEHHPPSIQQLLRRRELQALIETFAGLAPGASLALVRADGTLFVQHGSFSTPWPAAEIQAALQKSPPARIVLGTLSLRPLCVEGVVHGALAAQGAVSEAILLSTATSLSLLLASALEKRAIARETLDRYREINLLYRTGETIGASLDPDEILRLILTEAQEAIPIQSGAVLIRNENKDWRIGFNIEPQDDPAPLESAGHILMEQILRTGNPDIHVLPADSPRPGAALLGAPMKSGEHIYGIVILYRGQGVPTFTAGDEKLLMALASQAGISLEKAWLHQQEIQRQRMEEELSIGRQIQLSLLPAGSPRCPGWEFAAHYQAAREVGGDFYDFYELPEAAGGHIGLVIGDVTGKGVPAALIMSFSRAILRTEVMAGHGPREVLERFNRLIQENNRTRLFLSAIYAILNTDSGRFSWVNGGHELPVLVGRRLAGKKASCQELSSQGMLLGAFPKVRLEERTVSLQPGELLVFVTDGVTEARDAAGSLFGEDRLLEVLASLPPGGAEQAVQAIVAAVEAFTGKLPQTDDLTVLAVYRQEEGSSDNGKESTGR